MTNPDHERRDEKAIRGRGLTAIDAALLLIVVLLIAQMWLLSATLESFLAGHTEVAVPAAFISVALFAGCFLLNRFVARVDRRVRE